MNEGLSLPLLKLNVALIVFDEGQVAASISLPLADLDHIGFTGPWV